jgi:hyperosmotically inducible periplasmic protein
VGTRQDKQAASTVALQIPGVRAVDNQLYVAPSPVVARGAPDDARVRRLLEARFRDTPFVDGIRVASVEDGVVRLEGTARSTGARARALAIARTVPGVQRVTGKLDAPEHFARDDAAVADDTPKQGRIADETITTQVKLALYTSVHVPGTQVSVDTDDGRVTLFGKVPNEASRDRALQLARQVEGVTTVRNLLEIVPVQAAQQVAEDDQRIRSRLSKTLESDPRFENIEFDVADRVVRLTGTAADPYARLDAVRLARGAPGVMNVIQDIVVRPQGNRRQPGS